MRGGRWDIAGLTGKMVDLSEFVDQVLRRKRYQITFWGKEQDFLGRGYMIHCKTLGMCKMSQMCHPGERSKVF